MEKEKEKVNMDKEELRKKREVRMEILQKIMKKIRKKKAEKERKKKIEEYNYYVQEHKGRRVLDYLKGKEE